MKLIILSIILSIILHTTASGQIDQKLFFVSQEESIPIAKKNLFPPDIIKRFNNLFIYISNSYYHNYLYTKDNEKITNLIKEIRVLPVKEAKTILCLALNIYHEARGSIIDDQIATSLVVFNRVKHKDFPNTICKVVWQYTMKRDRKIAQFSWTRDGKSDVPKTKFSWIFSQKLAYVLYFDKTIPDITNGRLNYYAHNSIDPPSWARTAKNLLIIGNHTYLTANRHLKK